MGRLPGWKQLRRRAVMTPMGSAREVLADTQRFYRRRVFESWVRDYLHGRYLAGAIQPAGIGYAPAGWTTTTDHLLTLGHSRDDLVRAGVAVEGERGLRDVMRDRLTLPVHDHTGQLVGFLGRAHPDDARAPKYLNTPATELYEKRSTLYGLGDRVADLAAGATPLIVEGPFDKLAVDKMATRYGRHGGRSGVVRDGPDPRTHRADPVGDVCPRVVLFRRGRSWSTSDAARLGDHRRPGPLRSARRPVARRS